jgi:hypothetical protein
METRENPLVPGRVYRTRELKAFSANPTRWAKRLVRDGRLCRLAQGLYYQPEPSRFGPLPPKDRELLRAFLGDDRFLITGPPVWNALGLGSTAMFPIHLVYNHRRSGKFRLGNQTYWFRRVRYPEPPPLEWFVIDLLENADIVGADRQLMESLLAVRLREKTFDSETLLALAQDYGSADTLRRVEHSVRTTSTAR